MTVIRLSSYHQIAKKIYCVREYSHYDRFDVRSAHDIVIDESDNGLNNYEFRICADAVIKLN
jgi:hypothetical protein